MRTFLTLSTIATVAVLGLSPDARAAGTPPTVEFTFTCGPDLALIEWTVTNVDMAAHALEIVVLPDGDPIPAPLGLGEASIGGAFGTSDPGTVAGLAILEEGVVIASSGLQVADPEEADCWSEPQDIAPAEPVAPTVTFETHCDDGGTVVEIHLVNNDLGVHDVDAFLEPVGGPDEEIFVPELSPAEPEVQVNKFVSFGTTFQVLVTEGGVTIGVSPVWQALADDGLCAVEPDANLPIVPIDDIPLDQPTTTTTTPVPEPEPTTSTTSTTSSTSTTTPETTTTAPAQPVTTERAAIGELVRSFTPAPAGSADVPAVEPARVALPRTGTPVNRIVPLGWLLIGAGYLVKRAASRRP